MLFNLTKDASITAPNNKDSFWIGVRIQRQVSNHFLIKKLIALSDLDDIV